jgi:hypothetical protein
LLLMFLFREWPGPSSGLGCADQVLAFWVMNKWASVGLPTPGSDSITSGVMAPQELP